MAQASDSRSEYERRINRVTAHIDQHLDQPLDLEALAAVANFSAFHFHRLFRAWTGETLGDYLRRRRVEIGALRRVVDAHPDLRRTRQRHQPAQFLAADNFVGDEHVAHAAIDHRLGLADLLAADADRAQLHLL